MSQSLNTSGTSSSPIQVDVTNLGARGVLAPVLVVWAQFRTVEGWTADLLNLKLRVEYRNELLGEGWLVGPHVTHTTETTEMIEIPTSHRMIQYVSDSLGSASALDLEVRWSGLVRLNLNADATRRFANDPEPGGSIESQVYGSGPMNFQVARSDWFSKVLSSIRQEDFVYLEIAVPRGAAAAGWYNSLSLLAKAEEAYAKGDDTSVFANLRGVIDSLPGAKQHIFDALPEPKRGKIDDLVKSYGEYLHAGRHVAVSGPMEGSFPVDHLDAAFAISACKVLLSYASLALVAGSTP